MGNRGEGALSWQQNQNEIRSDTVNIGKGITITSTAKNHLTFKADVDGIRIINSNKNKSTEFTDDGMETDSK